MINNLFSNFDIKLFSSKYLKSDIIDEIYKNVLSLTKRRTRSDFIINCHNMLLLLLLSILFPDFGYSSILNLAKSFLINNSNNVSKILKSITSAGLCKARKRFNSLILKILWQSYIIIEYFKEKKMKLWKDFQVCAIDGTSLTLTKSQDILNSFPTKLLNKLPKMLACVLYDVYSKIPLDIEFDNFPGDERSILNKLICNLKGNILLLLDRGYPSYWLFYKLMIKNIHFIIRLPNYFNYRKVKQIGCNDWIIEIHLNTDSKRRSKKYLLENEYDSIPDKITLRLIKTQIKGFKPRFIITSLLDYKEYSHDDIAKLYCDRWMIENYYRELKHILKIEKFHAKYVDGIYQEIYASMILTIILQDYILKAAFSFELNYEEISFKRVFNILSFYIIILELCNEKKSIIDKFFICLIAQNIQDKRPGRSYNRIFYRKIKCKYNKWK